MRALIVLLALAIAVTVTGVTVAQEAAEATPFPPVFVQIVNWRDDGGGEPLPPLFNNGDTPVMMSDYVHLFPMFLLPFAGEGYQYYDLEGAGYLDLDVADYGVRFVAVLEGKSVRPNFNIENLSVTPCNGGRDNRVIEQDTGFEIVMFCPGIVEWVLESDHAFYVVVAVRFVT